MLPSRHGMMLLVLLPLVASACAQKFPVDEGRLVIALTGAPVNVDPRVATDAYGEQILQLTHASLVGRDAAGGPVPDLAQRWESPDPLTYVFHLRPGLRFHDGRPLTSADVRYTFAWILDPANRSPHRGLYRNLRAIETPDPGTVVFRLSEPFAPFLSTMVRGIVPAGSAARGYAPPVGAGPYRIDDLSPDGEAVLSAYDGYHGGAPAVRSVTVKFLPDSNVLFLELSQNEVHRRVATVIQEQLRNVGISVEIQSLEWGTFFSDIKKVNFQIYSLTWVGIAAPDIFHHAFHSRSAPPDGANRGR